LSDIAACWDASAPDVTGWDGDSEAAGSPPQAASERSERRPAEGSKNFDVIGIPISMGFEGTPRKQL
jgi:hypothetical protein